MNAFIILFLFFFINNVPNQNGKVLEKMLAGFNSDAVTATLTGLRNFKMTLPLLQVLKTPLPIPFSHIIEKITNDSIGLDVTLKLVGCLSKLLVHLANLSDSVCYMGVHVTCRSS